MGNRLQRYGFTIGGSGETVTAANIKQFMRDEILHSYALKEANENSPTSYTGPGIGIGGGTPHYTATNADGTPFYVRGRYGGQVYASEEEVNLAHRDNVITAEAARGLTGRQARPISIHGTQRITGVRPQGPELFNQGVWGQLFGDGSRIGNSSNIVDLFDDEEHALASLDQVFIDNPDLANNLFTFTQNTSNDLQVIRDDRSMSGGPIGGPLRVATAGLAFANVGGAGTAAVLGGAGSAAQGGDILDIITAGGVAALGHYAGGKFNEYMAGSGAGTGVGQAGTGAVQAGSGGSSGITTPGGAGGLTTAQGAGIGATTRQATGGLGTSYVGSTSPLVGESAMTLAGSGGGGIGYSPLAVLGGATPANEIIGGLATDLGQYQGGRIPGTNQILGSEQPAGLGVTQENVTNVLSTVSGNLLPGAGGGGGGGGGGGQAIRSSPAVNSLTAAGGLPGNVSGDQNLGLPFAAGPPGGGTPGESGALRSALGAGKLYPEPGRIPGYQRRPFANYLLRV